MPKVRESIKSYYALALAEGEGVGTAYEYYAKAGKLGRFLDSTGGVQTILIAGLPERFGFSMDFFLLAEKLKADVLAIDERSDRIQRAREVVRNLAGKGVVSGTRIRFLAVPEMADFGRCDLHPRQFDLGLSCEVLQRLDASSARYLSCLWQSAHNVALFVPNGGNAAHAVHSGLRSLPLRELLQACRLGWKNARIRDSGCLDMPPFPPGITRSQEKRDRAADSPVDNLAMRLLEVCCSAEKLWPGSVRSKHAHIAYVMAGHSV